MEFIKTHKILLGFGASCFLMGYAVGAFHQARSFEQEMAQNIFKQVTSSQEKLRSKFN